MKKWIIRIMAVLFGLVMLLFSGGFYLLGTESGTRFLVAQAEKQLDGVLRIGSSTGKLLDRIELTDILFDSPAGTAHLGRLVLEWKSTELLRLHLHILELTANDISYTAIPQEAEPEEPDVSGPLLLPELSLPITITIEQLGIRSFSFLSAPDAKALTVDTADLALFWDKSGIQLQELSLTMPEATLQIQGQVNPVGNYPLQLTSSLETISPDLPSLKLLGKYGGNLQELLIREELSGDIRAELDISLLTPIDALAWQADLKIMDLPPALFSPEIAGVLTGTLQSNGTLQQANLTAALSLRNETAVDFNWDAALDVETSLDNLLITVNQLKLQHADTPAAIELKGTAAPDGPLDLSIQWQTLQWPLDGAPEYSSTQGSAALSGSMDAYHLTVNTDLEGSAIPTTHLQLTTEGDTKSLDKLQLTAELLEGILTVQGKVQWLPAVAWQLTADAANINPGVQYAEWPGKLNWLLQSNGTIEEAGILTDILLKRLEGTLRQLPVSGKAQIGVNAETVHISDLRFSSGAAVLTAHGTLGNESKLQWQVDIAELSDLLPESSGQLSGTGTVQGKMDSPQLDVHLSASTIHLPQLDLEHLQTDAELDLSWQTPFTFELSATNLGSGENLVQNIAVQANGSREKHAVQLTAGHELAAITLGLSGGYLQEQWQGVLDSFSINSTDMGSWQLQEPAKLTAAATAVNLEQLCLGRENTALCLKGAWDNTNTDTRAMVSLNDFPLSWFSPWFPDTVSNVDGLFSLKADAVMMEKLRADISAEITPGTITYLTNIASEELPHQGMNLSIHVADDALNADVSLRIDSNTISGTLNAPDLLQPDRGGKAALDGRLLIDAEKFDVVEAMVPAIQELDAAIKMDFTVQGTVAHPALTGKGRIDIPNVLIPAAGLDLTDTTVDIAAANSEIRLNGKLYSPNGSMELDGKATLDSTQNWPARFTLKADNFKLINLHDIQVFLSSDLLLEKKDALTRLSGTVTIPEAAILLRELPPGTATASPDVVIIQETQEEQDTSSPLTMDLNVTLGDNVHFSGFGFNAFIDGELSITSEPEEQMMGSGAFHIKQGSYRAYGQDLDIQTGIISFPGGPLTQPGINLRATRTVGDVVAGISAIGPASKPRITTFSNPPMSEGQTLSYLLTGSAPDNAGSGTKLSIGRQINNKLNISVGTDVKTGDSEFVARYRLSRKISVQTTTATNSNAADVFYTVELGLEERKTDEQ